jgi:hypothetical protein
MTGDITRADLDDVVAFLQHEFKRAVNDTKAELENELHAAVDPHVFADFITDTVASAVSDVARELQKQQQQIIELQKLVIELRAGARRRAAQNLVAAAEEDDDALAG